MHQDIVFNIRGELLPAHRCILSARSPYFAELFRTRWKGRKEVYLKHKMVSALSFRTGIKIHPHTLL